MTDTQDVAQHPFSKADKEKRCQEVANLGATGVGICTPYNVPGPDAMSQTAEWIQAAIKSNLKIWLRPSWADDEGWYGVPKQITNDRIADTVTWIKAFNAKYPGLLRKVQYFTPKPEPQNMGVSGMNGATPFRFSSVAVFNKWLRDMQLACQQALASIGLSNIIVGHWGFDGFVVCGFNNPDWSGKSFLEPATVQALDNLLVVDHYPPTGTTLADFIKVFKQTWPGVKLGVGEYGTMQPTDKVLQLINFITDLNDPVFSGFFSYWNLDGGQDVALLNPDRTVNATGKLLRIYFQRSS